MCMYTYVVKSINQSSNELILFCINCQITQEHVQVCVYRTVVAISFLMLIIVIEKY